MALEDLPDAAGVLERRVEPGRSLRLGAALALSLDAQGGEVALLVAPAAAAATYVPSYCQLDGS